MAMQLSDDLKKEEGIEAAVINARFAKPIDTALLQLFGQSADVIVTFEDHVIKGGFGSGRPPWSESVGPMSLWITANRMIYGCGTD